MYVVARVTYISKGLTIILTVQHKLCIMLQFYNKVTGQLAYIFTHKSQFYSLLAVGEK